ncbi:MAG: efflux RND transporter permease subunit [Myxococcales bacterium]|nr:efflux RND transporter permease subunit [Myxococcales bacterium]MCB9708051.1 efflux RND transporter permease subunit [Myxococcales bacterium]
MKLVALLVRWSLANRAIVLVCAVVFIGVGMRSAFELPIDAVPDVTDVQVQVITAAPALSPVEVEQYVSIPVERAMAGVPHAKEVRSVSKYGLSVVTIVFEEDTELYFARQMVHERMSEAESAIPQQYGIPEMGPISSALGEVYQFTVRNPKMTLMQLEELLDWTIAPLLRTVPGIVEVNSFGGEDKQYQVVLDPQRLQATGVSIAQVTEALEKTNANAGGGYIEHNRQHFVIGTRGLVRSLEDLKRVVIGATPEGIPITIATVGDVQFGPRLRRGAATMDGKGETVVGVALMLMGENSRTVTKGIQSKLREIEARLPEGTRIEAFYDRAKLVNRTIKTVGTNLAEGALLVVLVLLLLLGDIRAGLVVATVIPLSLLFAVTVMNALGMSGNLMSLGAIDFGLIVDGAVIIVENAVRRLSEAQKIEGRPLVLAARTTIIERATLEVCSASVFGVAIVAIVYVPILALTGMEGKLFNPMAVTVLLALLGAFFLSLTLVPVLASAWIRPRGSHRDTWLVRTMRKLYLPVIDRLLSRPVLTIGAAVCIFACAVVLFTRLGAEFVPQLDEGDLLIEARRLPGISLTETVQTDLRIERAVLELPEVKHAVGRAGAPEIGNDPMGLEQSDIYIALRPRKEWRAGLSKAQLAEEVLHAANSSVPEVASSISQPIQMRTNELIAGIRSDVAVHVFGPDLTQLARIGEQIAEHIRAIEGAVDVRVEQVAGLPYLEVIPDRAKLARYGLTIADINKVTETMAVGHHVGQVLEGERRFGLVVKTQHGFGGSLDALEALPLRALSGQVVPLADVAEMRFVTGPAQVSRRAQSRLLTAEFNVRGRDLLSVVKEAEQLLTKSLVLPSGYRIEFGGQFEHYTEAKHRLYWVLPIVLALILFMLWLAFRSIRAALLILANVPFAVIGGIAALWLRGIPFSISAGVGFIALFGVAVLNGLVLVSFSRHLEADGLSHADAIREAAELRLRPVLMTALVASLGFLPMALSTAPGSEVQRPLATVVIGGIISATALTLLVFPVVYVWLGGEKKKTQPVHMANVPEKSGSP